MYKKINIFLNNKINCTTKKYSLIIGLNPSKGARSPTLWNKVYKNLKINCKMYPVDISKKNLPKFIKEIKKDKNFVGSAVTMPYKEVIIRYIDEVHLSVKKIKSINTIVKKNNKLIGYNTDYLACKKTLTKFKRRKKILILGAGGVGKSAILSAAEVFKKAKIFIYNRNYRKLLKFSSNLKNNNIKILKNFNMISKMTGVDMVVNATSVGFDLWQKNKKGYFNLNIFSPIGVSKRLNFVKYKNYSNFFKKNIEIFKKNAFSTFEFFNKNKKCDVFDIIYYPAETPLIKISNQFSNKVFNGLDMNLDQAVLGFSIVNNIKNTNLVKKLMLKK